MHNSFPYVIALGPLIQDFLFADSAQNSTPNVTIRIKVYSTKVHKPFQESS